MKHEESVIQAEIVDYLSALGIFFFSVPNEAVGGGPKAIRQMTRYKRMGLYPGMADLVIVDDDGRAYFLEVKTETGRASGNQRDFAALCAYKRYPYAIARSVEDAKQALSSWGFFVKKDVK